MSNLLFYKRTYNFRLIPYKFYRFYVIIQLTMLCWLGMVRPSITPFSNIPPHSQPFLFQAEFIANPADSGDIAGQGQVIL